MKDNKNKIDFLIIEYKKNNNEQIMEEIIKEFSPLVYKICNSWSKSFKYDTLEDLIQESNIILLKCIKKYNTDNDNKFITFYYKCLNNAFREKYRKNNYMKNKGNIISIDEEVKDQEKIKIIDTIKDNTVDIEIDYIDKELINNINILKNRYIKTLSSKKQNILNDLYDDNNHMKVTEIAKKYECSKSYISKINNELIKHLKKELRI